LNHNIKYIALEAEEVFINLRRPLLAALRSWVEVNGYELIIDTYEGLVDAGLIARLPDTSGFAEGLLFSFSDADFDGETLTVNASKWRSPRGATGAVFTVQFSDGNWIISEPDGWWMS
jgi:hypothetical protein